jgi:hypothetical protein
MARGRRSKPCGVTTMRRFNLNDEDKLNLSIVAGLIMAAILCWIFRL